MTYDLRQGVLFFKKQKNMGKKEELSRHVEHIFKQYVSPGLHICDIATGGGKSYTIGKLTCQFYPLHFKRIIILCVQNKLMDEMYEQICRILDKGGKDNRINKDDILVVEKNITVFEKAIATNKFEEFLKELKYQISRLKDKNQDCKQLSSTYNKIEKSYKGLKSLLSISVEARKNESIDNQINQCESDLRTQIRIFFSVYKKHLENTELRKSVSIQDILSRFKTLEQVFPQVRCRSKKVLLMTVHKAMYGIDPILSENFCLDNFTEQDKETLILFDESDLAALYMRDIIINQSIKAVEGSKQLSRGYNGYLLLKQMTGNPEQTSTNYFDDKLEKALIEAHKITNKNWSQIFKDVNAYQDIFLDKNEDYENYRRGVFFSGPILKLNIAPKQSDLQSFICYDSGDRHFILAHSKDETELLKRYKIVVPMKSFLSLVRNNTTSIKSQLTKVVLASLNESCRKFDAAIKSTANDVTTPAYYMGYPTLEREIYTLFSRFTLYDQKEFENQLKSFITNRKNLSALINGYETTIPDYSVYSNGVQLFSEEVDEYDNEHKVKLTIREIITTPEKIIIDLVRNPKVSVVLCSATSSTRSVVSNFDICYLEQILKDKLHNLSFEDREKFDSLVDGTLPPNHTITVKPVKKFEFENENMSKWKLPEDIKSLFSKAAQDEKKPEIWFRLTLSQLNSIPGTDNENVKFQIYRLFQFIVAYHWFYTHNDIHSMIYFQNRSGDKDQQQYTILSSLIDGSYKGMTDFEDDLPTNWTNTHLLFSKDTEEVSQKVLSVLSTDKEAKIMLVSAYGSFKAGANLQYKINPKTEFIAGDNWEEDKEKWEKDWDAIYVQSPTAYLLFNEDGTTKTFEESLYKIMLNLMMLYERGYLSQDEVSSWLNKALSGNFAFSEKTSIGIFSDKCAWAQTIVEQAVGRICRTKNKPSTTYILYDDSMEKYFDTNNLNKSLTKEFKTLADYILNNVRCPMVNYNIEEVILCNMANQAQTLLNRMRSKALFYTPKKFDEDIFDEDDYHEDNISYDVQRHQLMNQCYKRVIISKPIIRDLNDLSAEDKSILFMDKCYGKWPMDENHGYAFFKSNNKICPKNEKIISSYVSPSTVRLDVLMKNNIIKEHFIKNGFATNWDMNGLILHPQILVSDYAGEIGEEAFLAILYQYTSCTPGMITHLTGKDYELADFVICKPNGEYKIAFDVKNMNPYNLHDDNPNDIPTTEKRQKKRERLGCNLITVNIVEIEGHLMDEINEIAGIIDTDGRIIPSAIERLQKLISE